MTDTPTIGDNSGDTYQQYKNRVNDLVENANIWLKKVPEITDLDSAKACDDFLNQLKSELAYLDKERKGINAPWEAQVKANNDQFRPLAALLDKCKELLTPLKTKWLQRERERIDAERRAKEEAALQAMREAEEAAKKSANSIEAAVRADEAAKAADAAIKEADRMASAKATVKGDYSARASGLRKHYSAKVIDPVRAHTYFKSHEKMLDLIQQLANAVAREQKESFDVPGCELIMEERA